MANSMGLTAIAFADHNSIGSVGEGISLSREFGIEFIPCLEFNTLCLDHDLHMLAYFIDCQSRELKSWLEEIYEEKQRQAVKRIEKLNELGFVFSVDDVKKFSGDKIPTGISFLKAIRSREENKGDPRIKRFIDGDRSDSPYVNFYLDYLRGGESAFVPLETVDTFYVMGRIKQLGGIPVLAHPSDTGDDIILKLVEGGLSGLEVFSSYHNEKEEEHFLSLAKECNLLVTAGSDFHGSEVKPDVKLGEVRGNSYELVEKLKDARAQLKT
ncbi:MAG: PHP domain-containing protein [Deltaproteobacteria bacterium]|nr:PHP domain-containing protein [Deltaproteobacteria bacterium]